eukprot:TRINITY_DN20229_c0_g2_i1.p1 TRINITY_DN20229_c0_g2~~TRINITY_DN20229_c0_g2_i1.p1  ORF type:complete len:269 (+),score=43.87 TRINITY_DN20229_c0_g2_i1:184-990(+)
MPPRCGHAAEQTERVPRGSVSKALFWDTADPYKYVRISPCDQLYDFLIVGGEDHAVGHFTDKHDQEKPFRELEAWTRVRFPMLGAVEYKWSGEVWEPHDLVGIMGRDPVAEHMYIITGDSGTGMTHTTIGARLVADLIQGRPNIYEGVYNPKRGPSLRSFTSFMRYGLHSVQGLAGRVPYLSGDLKDIEDIGLGCGAVITKHGKKLAVYRAEDGTLSVCSAACPHLGGIVKWNDVEKSFDCQIHGSRFSKTGVLLNGPAVQNLSKAVL